MQIELETFWATHIHVHEGVNYATAWDMHKKVERLTSTFEYKNSC